MFPSTDDERCRLIFDFFERLFVTCSVPDPFAGSFAGGPVRGAAGDAERGATARVILVSIAASASRITSRLPPHAKSTPTTPRWPLPKVTPAKPCESHSTSDASAVARRRAPAADE